MINKPTSHSHQPRLLLVQFPKRFQHFFLISIKVSINLVDSLLFNDP